MNNGFKIGGGNINNLHYAKETTLITENAICNLAIQVKEQSE